MMNNTKINLKKICKGLLKDLSPRTRDVISSRFGLETEKKQTLEAIGKRYGITRERVRQIEQDGLKQIKDCVKAKKSFYQKEVFQPLIGYFKKTAGLKREDRLLSQFAGRGLDNHIFFLLTLCDSFERFKETKEFYPFWAIKGASDNLAKEIINPLVKRFEQNKKPVSLEKLFKIYQKEISSQTKRVLNKEALISFLEISKKMGIGPTGQFGLRHWPEINPKGIKDRAYLVFKEQNCPLHFTRVANLISGSTLSQTVHNELIRDPRFVLIGRGIYALKEWGYVPGQVREIISRVLKQGQGGPLSENEIIEKVFEQRLVKKETILLNLNNKKYFAKTPQGQYMIREA